MSGTEIAEGVPPGGVIARNVSVAQLQEGVAETGVERGPERQEARHSTRGSCGTRQAPGGAKCERTCKNWTRSPAESPIEAAASSRHFVCVSSRFTLETCWSVMRMERPANVMPKHYTAHRSATSPAYAHRVPLGDATGGGSHAPRWPPAGSSAASRILARFSAATTSASAPQPSPSRAAVACGLHRLVSDVETVPPSAGLFRIRSRIHLQWLNWDQQSRMSASTSTSNAQRARLGPGVRITRAGVR